MRSTVVQWTRRALVLLAVMPAVMPASVQPAAVFPGRPLTLVVPFPPGGTTDVIGRALAQGLAARLRQPVLVDNRAGAGGTLGAGHVAKAEPDGYTLMISSNSTYTVAPALRERLPFDPARSFESIGLVGGAPLVILAQAALPAGTLQELVEMARRQPGQISYGSFGAGTVSHLAGEIFRQVAGIQLMHVPYKGSAPAMTDLLGGHVQLTIDTPVAALQPWRAGKVKALAVSSATRSAALPGVPTIAEQGYPGFEFSTWVAVVTPRGLPPPVRQVLSRALADTLADPAVRSELTRSGLDVAHEPGSAYDARVARELPMLRAYVHKAQIRVD